ncbi:hypothetical protein O1611_g637 [Lasiodiplodia mahajangana]|uniref:Uncharacterized protein n=1 Tax=Lasiodiplodia mahajangana TaxID=1108764 RepID=A0ACC2K000_9PEZI|nr:hypothetical protein O1611_g637 [Lasiodiplodia mahajangana]
MSSKPLRFTDQEWEEVSSDIPQENDPFLQKYLEGREALIAEENKQRSDASFRQNLSPIAQRACAIVQRIRAPKWHDEATPMPVHEDRQRRLGICVRVVDVGQDMPSLVTGGDFNTLLISRDTRDQRDPLIPASHGEDRAH